MSNSAATPPEAAALGHVKFGNYDPEHTTNLALIERRNQHFAGSMLFYHDPVHIVRGEGVSLYDDRGQRYLDCYNNVASVGHCHPTVVAALTKQAGVLNTHTRYLHSGIINYAEQLTQLFPDSLDTCLFVCTGTEANELAMRMARAWTGKRGAVVMENAYHGNSTLLHELSTILYPEDQRPAHVAAVAPPNRYRSTLAPEARLGEAHAALVDDAIAELEANGEGLAAFMCDTIFDSQGGLAAPSDYFQGVYDNVRRAGGLCIADEVQAGLCRTGKWWGFEHYDVVPDIVTLGKPMGDGHPLAVVVTRREIAENFTASSVYFNTFGGNPVSAAVGSAVLEVCQMENLVENCQVVGTYLRERLAELAYRQPLIGHVHGRGLFLGVELVHDRQTKAPAADIARQVPDAMKQRGVIMGMTGPLGNVLKIRPPMVFSTADADELITALAEVLDELGAAQQSA